MKPLPTETPLLSYYGDDFTGSTDALEALTIQGVSTVLFLGIPDERIVVAPNNGIDRYPPYTAQVRTQASPPSIPATMGLSCTQDTSLSR